MDIQQLADAIYKDEPKAPREIRLEIDAMTNNVNEAFEVISLFFLEGINRKIIQSPRLQQKDLNIQRFIQQRVILLRQYCQSINIDFKLTTLTKKDVKRVNFIDRPVFYTKDKYPFFMSFFYKTIRRGKQYEFMYNPGKSNFNNLKDGIMILKIQNYHYRIQFDYL